MTDVPSLPFPSLSFTLLSLFFLLLLLLLILLRGVLKPDRNRNVTVAGTKGAYLTVLNRGDTCTVTRSDRQSHIQVIVVEINQMGEHVIKSYACASQI